MHGPGQRFIRKVWAQEGKDENTRQQTAYSNLSFGHRAETPKKEAPAFTLEF
jgi:hypothetical protein